MAIDFQSLPQETQDFIELKEATDMTFGRFLDCSYTDIFWNKVAERANPEVEHSLLLSMTGLQGCHLCGTLVQTYVGLKKIEDVVTGDLVWSGNAWRPCIPIIRGRLQTLRVMLRNGVLLQMTPDHKMQTQRGWVAAEDLVVGDVMIAGNIPWSTEWNDESERAMVVGMLLADGHLDALKTRQKYDYVRKSNYRIKKIPKESYEWIKYRVRLYNKDAEVHTRFCDALVKHYAATATGSYEDIFNGVRRSTVTCIQNESVYAGLRDAGVPTGNKAAIVEIPAWVQQSDAAMNGFLAGYFVCDGSIYGRDGGNNIQIEITSCSEKIIRQMQVWLLARGVISSVKQASGMNERSMQKWRLFVRQYESLQEFVDHVPSISSNKQLIARKYGCVIRKNWTKKHLLTVSDIDTGVVGDVFDLHVKDVHEYLANGLVSHNSGKCFKQTTNVLSDKGIVAGVDLQVGDVVFDECGHKVVVKNKWFSEKDCIEVGLDMANDVVLSNEHRLQTARGLVPAGELVIGDFVQMSQRCVAVRGSRKEYNKSFVFGAYLADGSIIITQKSPVAGKRNALKKAGWAYFVSISNNDKKYLEFVAGLMRQEFQFHTVTVRSASGNGRWVIVATGKEAVIAFAELCGKKSEEKRVPSEVFNSLEGVRGFLDGYCSGDMTCNVATSKKGTCKTEVGWLLKSESAAMGVLDALHIEDAWPVVRVRTLKSGTWVGNKYYRMTLPAKSVEKFFASRCIMNDSKLLRVNAVIRSRKERQIGKSYNTQKGNRVVTNDRAIVDLNGVKYARVISLKSVGVEKCVDIEVGCDSHLFQFAGGVVTHNSMSGITLCCALDPNFSIDNVFFGYDELVENRHLLKSNSAVLVDEQSEVFGLDSNRISIVLQNLKEQLRKKSIHFIFCAPRLYPEHESSMYIIETIYIDYEVREVVAALKMREGMTLGHIRIPHPLKLLEDGTTMASKELIAAYEKKKDEHLELVLGNKNFDIYEEKALSVMKNPQFKKAEKIYVLKMGYIPSQALVQIINRIYPMYNAGVVPLEIAQRIKMLKETSGKWEVAGHVTRRDRAGGKVLYSR